MICALFISEPSTIKTSYCTPNQYHDHSLLKQMLYLRVCIFAIVETELWSSAPKHLSQWEPLLLLVSDW